MSKSILKRFLFFVFCFFNFSLIAQNIEYTDHKPVYRKWQDSYILDKIQYTKNSTIFYFRFVCRSGQGISAIFYPPGGEAPWYLKGKSGKNYNLKSVRNIRRNSELLVSNLTSKKEFPSLDGFGYTVFSCEVHFEKLPNSEKRVDLIEGPGHEFDQNHFNCFDVIMKTQDDKELGQIKDSEENIKKFENKFGVTNTNIKPQPKIEPKVPPKKEDPITKIEIPKKEEPKTSPRKADPDNPYPISRVRKKSDIRCNEKMVLDKIQFQDNSTDFKGLVQCQETLTFVYDFLRENPKATATIIGHSDIFGLKEKNLELSKQRAYKVQRWLSMMGISPFRINVEFYGGQKAIVKEGSALNRRVELFIKCN